MPTPTKGPRLGGGPAHERLMLANLATSLFEHDQITTTEAKAKRLRPLAERLITFAKRGDLHSRRRVLTVVRDKGVVHRLFAEIAPDMALRPGGYTRITKIGARKGDNAPMAVIELVREPLSREEGHRQGGRGRHQARGQAGRGRQGRRGDQEGARTPRRRTHATAEPDDTETTPPQEPAAAVRRRSAGAAAASRDDAADGGYGPGSAAPNEDGSARPGSRSRATPTR